MGGKWLSPVGEWINFFNTGIKLNPCYWVIAGFWLCKTRALVPRWHQADKPSQTYQTCSRMLCGQSNWNRRETVSWPSLPVELQQWERPIVTAHTSESRAACSCSLTDAFQTETTELNVKTLAPPAEPWLTLHKSDVSRKSTLFALLVARQTMNIFI